MLRPCCCWSPIAQGQRLARIISRRRGTQIIAGAGAAAVANDDDDDDDDSDGQFATGLISSSENIEDFGFDLLKENSIPSDPI